VAQALPQELDPYPCLALTPVQLSPTLCGAPKGIGLAQRARRKKGGHQRVRRNTTASSIRHCLLDASCGRMPGMRLQKWLFNIRKHPREAAWFLVYNAGVYLIFNLVIEDRLAKWVNQQIDQRMGVTSPSSLGTIIQGAVLATVALSIVCLAIRIGWGLGRRRSPWVSDLLQHKVHIEYIDAEIKLLAQPILVLSFRVHNYGISDIHITGRGQGELSETAWGVLPSYWTFQESVIPEDDWATLSLKWNIPDPVLCNIAVATGHREVLQFDFSQMSIGVEAIGLGHSEYISLPGITPVGPFQDMSRFGAIRREILEL